LLPSSAPTIGRRPYWIASRGPATSCGDRDPRHSPDTLFSNFILVTIDKFDYDANIDIHVKHSDGKKACGVVNCFECR
jgi:hypothetical protein